MISVKNNYDATRRACFAGYIVQAVVNNFAPLLFLTFQKSYNIPLSQITMLVTFNFGLQIAVDLLSVKFVDRIGWRASMLLAHFCAAAGLVLLAVLPGLCPHPFAGLLISVMVYAVGGGLLEVLVSPVTEACPTANKEKAMSLLHSFYCWGQVGVVLLSTVYFRIFGVSRWQYLALAWALLPLCNAFVFLKVPFPPLHAEGEKGMSVRQLFSSRVFCVLFLMMFCAGASEQSVSQWASTFAEKGLGVGKTVGDLAGPMSFAALMGLSRAFYGKYGDRIDLDRFIFRSGALCLASYLLISLTRNPIAGLAGCALCGLSVGILWPGTFSEAAAALRGGDTAMFALLALAGDFGCTAGPTVVGFVSGHFGNDLTAGILAAAVFPAVLLLCTAADIRLKKNSGGEKLRAQK